MKNNTYRVFAFSEDVISIYNESNKSISCIENDVINFDTVIVSLFKDKSLELTYLKSGLFVSRSNVIEYGNYPKFLFTIELAGTTQPVPKEEPLFRAGDRVYDWFYGWMAIQEIKSHGSIVLLDSENKEHTFFGEHTKRLSFTEYNFVTGGWSQERQPKIGECGWFWDNDFDVESNECSYGKLDAISNIGEFQTKSNCYNYFSTKNPFKV